MREEKRKLMNGREVVYLVPENEKDVEEIRRRARSGRLDDRESFGDGVEIPPWRK